MTPDRIDRRPRRQSPAKETALAREGIRDKAETVPANLFLSRMEAFEQSPQGFWYPKSIHMMSGPNQQAGSDVPHFTATMHYHFDFDVALPDSLFVLDDASGPRE